MSTNFRVASFNLENLDDKPGQRPQLGERIALMRPQLLRLNADILCLQEVNGQEEAGHPRRLLALEQLLAGTPYAAYHQNSTTTAAGDQVYDERNLVILSRFPIIEFRQLKHNFVPSPWYQKVTADPPEDEAKEVEWERPILYAKIQLNDLNNLHVINLHLKSRLPSYIEGQKHSRYVWKSAGGWAEGFLLSSMKRVGQALETRFLIDHIFDEEEDALVAVCGDFNADIHEVPVEAIRGDVENTGNRLLSRRVMVPCEITIAESLRFSLFHGGKGRMIDHLLVSRNLLTYYVSTEIHNELLHDESLQFTDDKLFPESDHAPLVAEFAIPGN